MIQETVSCNLNSITALSHLVIGRLRQLILKVEPPPETYFLDPVASGDSLSGFPQALPAWTKPPVHVAGSLCSPDDPASPSSGGIYNVHGFKMYNSKVHHGFNSVSSSFSRCSDPRQ